MRYRHTVMRGTTARVAAAAQSMFKSTGIELSERRACAARDGDVATCRLWNP